MATASTVTTADELFRLSARLGRCELIRGELRTMSPSGFLHTVVAANVITLLNQYVRAHNLGVVSGCEGGFVIARHPDTVLAPDAAFVRRDRILASGIPSTFWDGAPELAVEVTSPGDTMKEVEGKVEDWLTAGASLVWVVNPLRRTVAVHRLGHQVVTLGENDSLDGQEIVTGFRCLVAEIMA